MNGFWLLLPFLLIRFGLLSALNPKAVRRAAHFAPVQGAEKVAYCVYQVSTAAILLYPFFLTVRWERSVGFYIGSACYFPGLCLCAAAMMHFSAPDDTGLNTNGIYHLSRNPMYVAYFLCFLGMAFLTRSVGLLVIVLIFQVSARWIILAEERWCVDQFGTSYQEYMKRVGRYL